jgi:hypothetical protein
MMVEKGLPEGESTPLKWPGFGKLLTDLFNAAADAKSALDQLKEIRAEQKRQGELQVALMREVTALSEQLKAGNARIEAMEKNLNARVSDFEKRIDERAELILLRRLVVPASPGSDR